MTRARKPKKPSIEIVSKNGKVTVWPWLAHAITWCMDRLTFRKIYIGFAVLIVGGLYLPTIRYMNAKPMIVAQCDTNAYAEALILRAMCSSTEHCTEREVTNADAIKAAMSMQWMHCNAEPPTRPDQHVMRAAHSVVQASAEAYRDWRTLDAVFYPPVDEVEEVLMAEVE